MRPRRLVIVGAGLFTAVRGVALPTFWVVFPLYLLSLGYRIEDLGLIATASSLATAASLPILGYLIDSGHAPAVATFSAIASTAAFWVPLWRPDLIGLSAAYILSDIGMSSWYPARAAIVARTAGPGAVGRVVGIYVILFNIARIVSPYVAGSMSEVVGYAEVMYVFGLASAAGFAVALAMIVRPYYRVAGPAVEVPRGEWSVCPILPLPKKVACIYLHGVRLDRRVYPLAAFAVLDRFAWMLWMPIQNAYLKTFAGFGDAEVGLYNSLMGAAMMAASYPAGWLTDRVGAFKTLAMNEFIGAAGAVAITLPNHLSIYASAALFGASIALWAPAYDAAAARILGGEHVGRVRAGVDTVRTVLGIPAPTAGSAMYAALGPASPFLASAALMVAASLPLIRARRS